MLHVIYSRTVLSCDLVLLAYIYSQYPLAFLFSLNLDISIINNLLLDSHSALISRSYEPGLCLNAFDYLLVKYINYFIS